MLGNIIRQIRENRGFTIDELAIKAALPIKLIEEIENGNKEISSKVMSKFITILDITEEELLGSEVNAEKITVRNIGDRIRALRENNKQKLNDLAKMSGISLTYLSELERGNINPPIETLRKIADVLNVPVSIFLAEKRTSNIIAAKMKLARKTRNLTQKELAAKAGISPGLIGQLEMGKVNASFKTIKKISEVLGVSVCYLILEQEEVEEIIGGLSSDLRNMLYDPKVQLIIGSICALEADQLKMSLNFIDMLKNSSL